MTKKATKLRNRRRKRARQRPRKDEIISLGPNGYRIGLLLWAEEAAPEATIPAHRQEIDECIRRFSDTDVVKTIRAVACLTVPRMISAVLDGNPDDYAAYQAVEGFDAYRFRDEIARQWDEIAAAQEVHDDEPNSSPRRYRGPLFSVIARLRGEPATPGDRP